MNTFRRIRYSVVSRLTRQQWVEVVSTILAAAVTALFLVWYLR